MTFDRLSADRNFVTPSLSLYLDLIRVIASLAVLVGHAIQDGIYSGEYFLDVLEHERVIILFVLSGLLIAHASSRAKDTLESFLLARLSRIISASYPAIVFSFLLGGIALLTWGSDFDLRLNESFNWWSLVSSLLFLNQSWGNNTDLPWNYPFWSICYEVFFYLIFGAFAFLTGMRRWIALFLLAVIAGPPIILLLPAWALGAYLIYERRMRIESKLLGLIVFVISAFALVAMSSFGLHKFFQSYLYQNVPGWWRLGYSQTFLTDYLAAALVVLNFCAMRVCGTFILPVLLICKPIITFLSSFAFSIYLFHRPITLFSSKLGVRADDKIEFTVFLIVTLIIIYFLSKLGESRRDNVKDFLEHILFRIRRASVGKI